MRKFRGIPIDIHGAVETFAAPAVVAAPFLLGFGAAAGAITFIFGVLLFGLAISIFGEPRSVPLHAHEGFDYLLGGGVSVAGIAIGVATGDLVATVFLVGIGIAHIALAALTRFTAPRGV